MTYPPRTLEEKLAILGPMIKLLGWTTEQYEAMLQDMKNGQPDIQISEPQKIAVSKQPPDWMADKVHESGYSEYLAAVEPELTLSWVKYHTAFPYEISDTDDDKTSLAGRDEKNFLYLLMSASYFQSMAAEDSINKWLDGTESYPTDPLDAGKFAAPDNPWVKVRSHYLQQALVRLLQIVKAPPAMMEDLAAILDLHKPRSAEVRAQAQTSLMANPTASAREVARTLDKRSDKFGAEKSRDHGQISKDLSEGRLFRPSTEYSPTRKIKKKTGIHEA